MSNSKLYVGNLSFKTTEDELAEQLFNISSGVGTTTAAEKRERIVEAVARRQEWYADVALDVWNVRNAKLPTIPDAADLEFQVS